MNGADGIQIVQEVVRRLVGGPALPALVALVLSFALVRLEPRGRAGLVPALALAALAWLAAHAPAPGLREVPFAVGLAVAALARDRDELLHGECALKLAWVLGCALALSWAGLHLLTLATGTDRVPEQWAVLTLGLDASVLWSTALPLSLLAGLVLLGGAPFHFWVADVFQGVRPWLAPLVVATLQAAGASWLLHRLAGIEEFPAGAELARALLVVASLAACIAGAATISVQRRPERRAGTLASLQGGLVLAMLAGGALDAAWVARWTAHLLIAYVGAATLAHFLPVSSARIGPGAPLFRRHPIAGLAGLLALASLAGMPGTPGMALWLDAGRALVSSHHVFTTAAFAVAWLASLAAVLEQAREGFGLPVPGAVHALPRPARFALGVAGVLLLAMAVQSWA